VKKVNLLFTAAGFWLLISCTLSDTGIGSFLEEEGINTRFQQVFEENELMGLSVLFVFDSQTVWEGCFGMADSAREIPVSDRTLYRIASISKMFTATALLQLWEAGRVDLDTDVSRYLGWKLQHPRHAGIPITLRHLMSHRSGIRDGEAYYAFSGAMIQERLDIRELFQPDGKYYADELFSEQAPGTFFHYANCTWGLVATVVEKISGERFDDYCRQHILEPLGMVADFNVAEIDSVDDIAVLYRFREGAWVPQADDYQGERPESRAFEGYRVGQNGLIFGPQGSLRSSARDLSRFMLLFLNDGTWNGHRLLNKETVEMMMAEAWTYDGTNGRPYDDLILSYGLGVHRTLNRDSADIVFPDRKMAGHPGDAYGLLSGLYFDKESGTGIIIITNGGKQITSKGVESAFYKVEEDAYSAAYKYLNKLETEFR
jgi:CubicO group peptidase (beta-lactamase class C family)